MDKKQKDKGLKLGGSYLTMVISVSLVLFLLGIMTLFILNASHLAKFVRENIGFSLIIENETNLGDILKLQKELEAKEYVKTARIISKEEAAEQLKKDLGEDFIGFLGYNPLLASIEVKMNAQYANSDSLIYIEADLKKYSFIKEVAYQKSLVHLVNENIRKITIILLFVSILLFIIAITLINNTVRLAIYAKRFIINTMQIVGATRFFIRKPFMKQALIIGLISSFLASSAIVFVIYYSSKEMEGLFSFMTDEYLLYLISFIFLLGIVINYTSTYLAVNKYLNIKTDRLYQ